MGWLFASSGCGVLEGPGASKNTTTAACNQPTTYITVKHLLLLFVAGWSCRHTYPALQTSCINRTPCGNLTQPTQTRYPFWACCLNHWHHTHPSLFACPQPQMVCAGLEEMIQLCLKWKDWLDICMPGWQDMEALQVLRQLPPGARYSRQHMPQVGVWWGGRVWRRRRSW